MNKTTLPDYDMAVIGGGAGGLYTAWRMLLDGAESSELIKKWIAERGSLKIGLFEMSDRIGGRVLSAKAPGLPDTVCEIGGMRFVSSQRYVASLVQNHLKLPVHEQAVDEPNNICYLRGKKLRTGDLSNPDHLPYHLSEVENEWLSKVPYLNTASNFLGYAILKIFPQIQEQNLSGDKLREWLMEQKDPNDSSIPLYEVGFWNLIAPVLSHEAYQIAITTVGYDCLGFNTNAVDTIVELFDFVPGVKYFLLDQGYDSMLWMLQEQFEQAGGDVLTNMHFRGFDAIQLQDESTGVELDFHNLTNPLTARAIVLAMPQRSINLLDRRGPVLDWNTVTGRQTRILLDAVEPIHLYKMFIAYPYPWWEKLGVTQGRSLTDTPVRQCYYWATEKGNKTHPENTNSIIMVYNDAKSSDFWGGLRHIPLGPGDAESIFSSRKFKRQVMPYAEEIEAAQAQQNPWEEKLKYNWKISEAPAEMVEEMHRQLCVMHEVDIADVPRPIEAAFKDWADDPYGGAVHFWNPGYNSTKTMNAIIQPVDSVPCYICGEAYSQTQTWVEGAFETAELVLSKFGIADPKWLTKNGESNKSKD